MINIITDRCINCGKCVTSCIGNAIKFETSELGKWHYGIDDSLCIHCENCAVNNNCVGLTDIPREKDKGDYSYIISGNNSGTSQSSGLCNQISKAFLTYYNSGIVIGVESTNIGSKYTIVNSINDIDRFNKTKYVHAEISDSLLTAVASALADTPTLIIGLPCDILLVRNYLIHNNINTDNFYSVSLLCDNAPQEEVVNRYIAYIREENNISEDDEVINIIFRLNNITRITFKSGTVIEDSKYLALFYSGELSAINKCFNCVYRYPKIYSDIIIGDNWEDYDSVTGKINSNIISLATEKGRTLINNLGIDLSSGIKIDKDYICNQQDNNSIFNYKNNMLKEYVYAHANDASIFDDIIKFTHPKIGIMGFINALNIGSKLSLIGLYNECNKLTDNVVFLGSEIALRGTSYGTILSSKDYPMTNTECDNIIIGPDHLWEDRMDCPGEDEAYAGMIYGENLIGHNKISYATSGPDSRNSFRLDVNGDNPLDVGDITRLDAVSVREMYTKNLLLNEGLSVYHAIDPLFFMTAEEWLNYMPLSKVETPDYIVEDSSVFGFALRDYHSEETFDIAERIGYANCYTKKIYPLDIELPITLIEDFDVYNFINQINNSDITITDSYHAFCFAILFNKPVLFVKYNNFRDNRINDLISKLELPDLTIDPGSSDEVIAEKVNIANSINYGVVNVILNEWITECKLWLRNNITL